MTENNQQQTVINPPSANGAPGPLRSDMNFTLHTKHATKLWHGRSSTKDAQGEIIQSSILGIPNCLSILTQIQYDAAQDDPYADDYLIKFEEKVLAFRQDIKVLIDKLVGIYATDIPENFDVERSASISPVTYQIHVNSQLGYQLLYLLADFDTLARITMSAAHFCLMTREEASEWIEEGAKLLRKCFGVVERYKHSGITRQDARENNRRYQDAVKRMNYQLPQNVLSGEYRARFAPYIKTASTASVMTEESDNATTSDVTAENNTTIKAIRKSMNTLIPDDMYKTLAKNTPLHHVLKQLFSNLETRDDYQVLFEQITLVRQTLMGYQSEMVQYVKNSDLRHLPINLIKDKASSSGGTFLRWRSSLHSGAGKQVWLPIVADNKQPAPLRVQLAASEKERILINMQISILNFILRQLSDCKEKFMLVDENVQMLMNN